MSIAIASANDYGSGGPVNPAQTIPIKRKKSPIEIIKSDKTKRLVNYILNGSSTTLSLLTFLNGNFNFIDSIQEKLEKCSEILTKIAYSKVSLIGAIDLWEKKNPLALLGYALSVPLPFISTNYNLWLASGIPQGLCNFILITDQREIVDKNGEPIPDKDGNAQLVNGDFGSRGWWNGFLTTFIECAKITKEIIQKPERIKKISHSIFVSSLLEMLGPVISYIGQEKIGAFVRNTANIGIQTAMLFHKESKDKTSVNSQQKINLKSPVAQSGLLWIGTSIIDFLKRFDFISERVTNLTHLSLGLDRGASILFTNGLLNVKNENI